VNEQSLPTNLQSAETGSMVYAEGWIFTVGVPSLLGKSCLVMHTWAEPTGYGENFNSTPTCKHFGLNSYCEGGVFLCGMCKGTGEEEENWEGEFPECDYCEGLGSFSGTCNPDNCPACNGEGRWKNIKAIQLQPIGETSLQLVLMNADGTTYSFEWMN
jgi:hypothetical protein|tara:strand:+ start:2308 stop:2781 length:474 start_codon:yes stop_codon:yes gene_type:complete